MTPVIKSADRDSRERVRALSLEPVIPPPSAHALAVTALEARLAAALEQTATLEAEVVRLNTETEAVWTRGRDAGVAEGRRAAEDRSEALLAAVVEAADLAVKAFQTRLESLDLMAADLAGLALARIAAEPENRRDLVAGAVRRALTETAADAVVRIEVSCADFADPAAAAAAVGAPGAEIAVVDAPSGACRIRLRLGELDLGLDGQIARLRALFETAGDAE